MHASTKKSHLAYKPQNTHTGHGTESLWNSQNIGQNPLCWETFLGFRQLKPVDAVAAASKQPWIFRECSG
jgi:hypothetical protein